MNARYKEAIDLLVKAFTLSGGEALAQNKADPSASRKPRESVTVEEIYRRLQANNNLEEHQKDEVLRKYQEWYTLITQLIQQPESWQLLQQLTNLYHAGAGVKPVDPDMLKQTLSSTFIRGLQEKSGFQI